MKLEDMPLSTESIVIKNQDGKIENLSVDTLNIEKGFSSRLSSRYMTVCYPDEATDANINLTTAINNSNLRFPIIWMSGKDAPRIELTCNNQYGSDSPAIRTLRINHDFQRCETSYYDDHILFRKGDNFSQLNFPENINGKIVIEDNSHKVIISSDATPVLEVVGKGDGCIPQIGVTATEWQAYPDEQTFRCGINITPENIRQIFKSATPGESLSVYEMVFPEKSGIVVLSSDLNDYVKKSDIEKYIEEYLSKRDK